VEQAAEEITPFDLWHGLHRVDVALLLRYAQLDAAVRSLGGSLHSAAQERATEEVCKLGYRRDVLFCGHVLPRRHSGHESAENTVAILPGPAG